MKKGLTLKNTYDIITISKRYAPNSCVMSKE